jgi:hypothetical protein
VRLTAGESSGPIEVPGTDRPLTALGLRGDRVALGSGSRATVASIGAATAVWSRELDWVVRRLELSRSGRFLLAESKAGDALEVWDVERDRRAARFDSARPVVRGALAYDRDLLVVAPAEYELEGHDLEAGERLFAGSTRKPRAFSFERIVPAADGDTLLALGHYFGEGRDSLLVFSLDAIARDSEEAARVTATRKPFDDYAYRLAAGPCGPEHVVVFRDPGDDEEPDEDDDDPPDRDVFGYRGLYVRSLRDGSLVERVPYDGPLVTGDPLLGTDRLVAVGSRERLDLVPRGGAAETAEQVAAAAVAFDPAENLVAYVDSDGGLRLLAL